MIKLSLEVNTECEKLQKIGEKKMVHDSTKITDLFNFQFEKEAFEKSQFSALRRAGGFGNFRCFLQLYSPQAWFMASLPSGTNR
jgi:hypothetical protein